VKKSLCITVLAILIFSTSNAFSQLPFGISAGPCIGSTVKKNKFLAGGQIELKIASFTLAPNIEKIFVKNVKEYNINLDGQYDIYGVGVAKMFMGGGYVIHLEKPDGGSRNNGHGFDIQIGGKAGFGSLHFFGVVKYTHLNHGSDEALILGANFGI
jgi:hypothetical protein